MYSQRASSSTSILFRDGMAVKSKLSRLFTAGEPRIADAALDQASFLIQQFELGQPEQVARMIDAVGRAPLPGQFIVLPQKRRQLQLFQVVGEQNLGRGRHATPPVVRGATST